MRVYKTSYHPFKKSTHSFPQSFLFLSKTKLFPTRVSKYFPSFYMSTKLKLLFHSIVKCHEIILHFKTACVLQRQNISFAYNKIKTIENIFNQQDVAFCFCIIAQPIQKQKATSC